MISSNSYKLGRNVICSFKLYDYCKTRNWKNREIYPDAYCGEDDFYYFNEKTGNLRRINVRKKKIYTQIYEYVEGFGPVPTIFQKCVRIFK